MRKVKLFGLISLITILAVLFAGCTNENKGTTFTVTFDYDYGYKIDTELIKKGDKVVEPTIPTRDGYMFVCWQKDGERFDFNTAINSDILLKAVWTTTREINVVVDNISTKMLIPVKNSYQISDFNVQNEGVDVLGFYQIVNGVGKHIDLANGLNGINTIYAESLVYNKINDNEVAVRYSGDVCNQDLVIKNSYFNLPVTTILKHGLQGKKIKSIILPSTLVTISEGAFSEVEIDSITIPSSVKNIEKFAFANSTINNINFEEGSRITELGDKAFVFVNGLRQIVLPSGLTTLKTDTFLNSTSLQKVFIPSSVKLLEEYIFDGCVSLKTIYLQKTDNQTKRFLWDCNNKGVNPKPHVKSIIVDNFEGLI